MRNDFGAEIAIADEERHDEHAWRGNFRENFFDVRLLLPERFMHLGKNPATAQFRRVLDDRRGGLVVQLRPVAEQHQRGIAEISLCTRQSWRSDARTASRVHSP